ncbi:MAG: hypothetical protein L0H53_17005 [Candidatus Nitrosocosmicus sp.]|nr:hypothetical protein [Candidatus Nitrosocosmicus sp.]MDN5869080.1 hypothetical protein [Candidatus Nitrosocosmicus sp.]
MYLFLAVAGIGIVSGIMVDCVEIVGQKLGSYELFIGAAIVGIVGMPLNIQALSLSH